VDGCKSLVGEILRERENSCMYLNSHILVYVLEGDDVLGRLM
jgi:hypothetical protein